VFLDRDGVLNRSVVREGKPHPPHSVEEVEVRWTGLASLPPGAPAVWPLAEALVR